MVFTMQSTVECTSLEEHFMLIAIETLYKTMSSRFIQNRTYKKRNGSNYEPAAYAKTVLGVVFVQLSFL